MMPSLILIPYLVAKGIGSVLWWLGGRFNKINDSSSARKESLVAIESGIRGWEIIEYKEMFLSAKEYFGDKNVAQVRVRSSATYATEFFRFVRRNRPSHYVYSPRTGLQSIIGGYFHAFFVHCVLSYYRVVAVAMLTDLPIRLWRGQCGVVTANRGIVVCLMSPAIVRPLLPHGRFIGPMLMPLSEETASRLKREKRRTADFVSENDAIFTGSLYEPRTEKLLAIKRKLNLHGRDLEILGRELGSERVSDEQYWLRLSSSKIVVTTADQLPQRGADWPWIPHFIYRYTEVLASGSLLVAPKLPGIEKFFAAGVHYVAFEDATHAAELIDYYLEHEGERRKIAEEGEKRIGRLTEARVFWLSVDLSMGIHTTL